MDAVGGLRGHQRHPLTGAETKGAARRLIPLRPGPRSSRGSSPAMVAGVLLMNLRTTWAAIAGLAGFVGAIFRWIGDLFTAGGIG